MEDRKLRPKYQVYRIDEESKSITRSVAMLSTDPADIDSPFVLMPRKDPAAFFALRTYANCCEPRLGNEIRTWLRKIADAYPLYGTQGIRNHRAMRMALLAEVD